MSKLTYEERLRKLNLPTLTYRRFRGDMIETYKIMHEIYDKDVTSFLKTRNQEAEITSLTSHKYQLYIEQVNKNIRKYNFSIRIINIWNSLPREVAEAPVRRKCLQEPIRQILEKPGPTIRLQIETEH